MSWRPTRFPALAGLLFALLSVAPASAQTLSASVSPARFELAEGWTLKLDGQYRARFMGDTSYDFAGGDTRANISHRARLGAMLRYGDLGAIRLLVQDVRIWGEESNTLNDFNANGFDVQEAFVELGPWSGLSLRVGRQEQNLDQQRLVGAVAWSQRGRSFDGLVGKFRTSFLTTTAFYHKVREVDRRGGDGTVIDPPDFDTDFVGVHVKADLGPYLKFSAMGLSLLSYGAEVRHTLGAHLEGTAYGLSYQGEFYYQLGELQNESVRAYLGAARIGYQLDVPLKPKLTVWYELLSGDGTPQGTFNTLFATNHKFYGEMDFFLNIPRDTQNLGLNDIGGRLNLKLFSFLKFNADFHHYRSQERGPNNSQTFGSEIDARFIASIGKFVSLTTVYGVLLPGELIGDRVGLTGSDLKPEHLVYVTLNAKI